MSNDAIVVSADELRVLVERVLVAAGVPANKAEQTAEPLVLTNLRAVDSHGVQALPHYIGQIERGEVDAAAVGHPVSENGSCMVYDGEHGLGQVTARECCAHAVRLARAGGLGMVAARECNHFGAAFFWAQLMSAEGFIGVVTCDASMQVPPWQGREPRLGTNPICVSVPHPQQRGWLLDMATTTVAYGKLEQSRLKGDAAIPPGWALDRDGVPTIDIASAALLMPLGGYKGSGLAMLAEILSGVLAGGEYYATQVTGIRHKGRPMRANQMFLAIDVRRFMPLEQFYSRMEWFVTQVKSAPAAKGYDEVLVAGEPEDRAEEQRRREGIPIPAGVWDTIVEVARRYGVETPR